jgi:hypothetical protein
VLTLLRAVAGKIRVTGVLPAPCAVFHPWLKAERSNVLTEMEKKHLAERPPFTAVGPVGNAAGVSTMWQLPVPITVRAGARSSGRPSLV